MFQRPHHQRIAHILHSLNGERLAELSCYFGGGTAIALRCGEFRESVDIDFLVSDANAYRELRNLLTTNQGLAAITKPDAPPLVLRKELRADQYGIRTSLLMDGHGIKFEIVREARIALEKPGEQDLVCGIPTLTVLDLATSKLLANSDRWGDTAVFSRDVIDLAMLGASNATLRKAVAKAEAAYGESVLRDLGKAIAMLDTRVGWAERCIAAMQISAPKALIWQRLRVLRKLLPQATGAVAVAVAVAGAPSTKA